MNTDLQDTENDGSPLRKKSLYFGLLLIFSLAALQVTFRMSVQPSLPTQAVSAPVAQDNGTRVFIIAN